MESGRVVEYIDRQKILCAVVLEVKKQRLRLLTENNREVNLSAGRLLHRCATRIDPSLNRLNMVEALKEIANRRQQLISQIDIKELWEILNTEQEWIDLETMTEFCFPNSRTDDHPSAVLRAFFQDRLYFKFSPGRFLPNSVEQVDRQIEQTKQTIRRNKIIQEGATWLKLILTNNYRLSDPLSAEKIEILDILKSIYLFEKESQHYQIGKDILTKAGIKDIDKIFSVLVKLGVWEQNENVDLLRFNIPVAFPPKVVEAASDLVDSVGGTPELISGGIERKDLTDLQAITIDGQATLDYDDAISLEHLQDGYRLGIHIVDVGHYVKKSDAVDREAFCRGSSIYMPDGKIPMLPSCLAEDLCSLKAGELRPALSTLVYLDASYNIIDYEILPSLISVRQQYTYYDINQLQDEVEDVAHYRDIALKFRQTRFDNGAIQISLPEIYVWLSSDGEITINRINRESPGRMLISELMIMANWLMAKFLKESGVPAVYRSQPAPKERLFKDNEGSLFQNIMQRRLLSRFVLSSEPDHHSGLGLEAYLTGTSPIRKYFDLVTQRQVRAALGMGEPYSSEEIDNIINMLEQPIGNVARIQQNRTRYWILKYLESCIGRKEEAILLLKRRNGYQILLPQYMIECDLLLSSSMDLQPEDLIQVTIQHVNARKDLLSVYVG
ncbi:MAG: RNB domain-containing ribonuclease [Desulfobacterales bacterium]|jgi:exoribonuclease-2